MSAWFTLVFVVGCGTSLMEETAPTSQDRSVAARDDLASVSKSAEGESAPARRSRPAPAPAAAGAVMADEASEEVAAPDPAEPEPAAADGGDAVRRWFPEAFLWQPLVETSGEGTAEVAVRVPDTLTTWRVLALAHDAGGQQTGAVTTFDSRLPVYVDPVVPGWLYAGDRVELPVQVVNTTTGEVQARLEVSTAGALTGSGSGALSLAAGGSVVRRVSLIADSAGDATVFARLEGHDAAERAIPVAPTGRPVEITQGGLLGGPRVLTLRGPAGADPRTQELGVLVFPGPVAVVHAEIARVSVGEATPAHAAYGYALAARLDALAERSGVEVDAAAQRRLRLLAWQRVVRHARSPDPGAAADLLAAMQDVGDQDLAQTLRARLVRTLVDGQRADGTWARQQSGPLQQVIVQTAFAARALPEDQRGARLRAAAALERYALEVADPYTAAVVLATGLVDGGLAERLRAHVTGAVSLADDGSPRPIAVTASVLNPWGRRPSGSEMQAWATLALADAEDVAWRNDLVAPLMADYDATRGFGAGAADVIALEAVVRALPGLDRPVEVVLRLDDVEVSRQALDPKQPLQPALLLARPAGADPVVTLDVEGGGVGLAYIATLASWVPWTGDEAVAGVEVEVEAGALQVGQDARLTLRVVAPSGVSVGIVQGLPAGATVDEDALGRVDGLLERHVGTDRVTLRTRGLRAGEILTIPLVVRPAFAGTFTTTPLVVEAGRERVAIAPITWRVSPEGALAGR